MEATPNAASATRDRPFACDDQRPDRKPVVGKVLPHSEASASFIGPSPPGQGGPNPVSIVRPRPSGRATSVRSGSPRCARRRSPDIGPSWGRPIASTPVPRTGEAARRQTWRKRSSNSAYFVRRWPWGSRTPFSQRETVERRTRRTRLISSWVTRAASRIARRSFGCGRPIRRREAARRRSLRATVEVPIVVPLWHL